MKKYLFKLLFYYFVFTIILIFNRCAAGLALEEAAALRLFASEAGAGALRISARGVLIADEAILANTLDRVFIESSELFVRVNGKPARAFGTVTGRNTAVIRNYGKVEFPGEIYRVTGDRVRVRSSLSEKYDVLQLRNTGQIVLKIKESNGWAYVETGNNVFGWMSLAYLSLISDSNEGSASAQFHKCSVCQGNGHAIQNVNCQLCHGSGLIDCGYCNGIGKRKCYQCNGKGQKNCTHCYSKGSLTCQRCFGNGYIADALGNKTTCTYCSGTGSYSCTDCNGIGSTICNDCSGNGEINCNYCHGSKKDVCYQCYKKGILREDIFCEKCLGTGWIKTNH